MGSNNHEPLNEVIDSWRVRRSGAAFLFFARVVAGAGREFLGGCEFVGGVGSPGVFFFVEVEDAGEEFEFVAEEIEGDAAGEVGEVFELGFAERDWELRAVEDKAAGICGGFVEEDDMDVGDLEGGLIDGDGGVAGGVSVELDFPGAFALAEGHIASEEDGVNGEGEAEGDKEMAR